MAGDLEDPGTDPGPEGTPHAAKSRPWDTQVSPRPGEISYTGARAHESSHYQYIHRNSAPKNRPRPERGHHGFLHVGLRHRSERHSGASPQGAVRTELHANDVDSVHLLFSLFSDV